MKHSDWLARLAILAWVSWLALLGLMFGMLRWNAWHPHFLPVTAVLLVMIAAALALVIVAGWRLVAGPRRATAFRLLLLGLPPLAFQTGYFMYGLHVGYGRQLDLNLPIRMLIPFGESMLDLAARFAYPVRTEGERVVMISAPMANAREHVVAMDRHIRALEARLGRTGTRRVHWVRGPLLGLQGKALYGICFGSLPGEHPADAEGLTTLDRHEVAHVVLSQFCTTEFEPPAVLMEGWAEVASGLEPNALILRAWGQHRQGKTLSLRELVSPHWYGRHEWPVYREGALLVDFILRKFGPERFVDLYRTSWRATFAADCQRILGVSLDELDRECHADIERTMGPHGYHGYWLRSLKLGPRVDPEVWKQFVAEHMAAAQRLTAAWASAQVKAEETYTSSDASGTTTKYVRNFELQRSGPFRALSLKVPEREDVYLARPDDSWRAERKPDGAWEIHDDFTLTAEQAYKLIVSEIDLMDPFSRASAPLIALGDMMTTVMDPLCLEVAQLERVTESGRPIIRIRLEGRRPGYPFVRSATMKLAAREHAVISAESAKDSGATWHSETVYETHDGVPVAREVRGEGHWPGGERREEVLKVTDSRFGPVAESEFSADKLLAGAPVRHLPPAPEPSEGWTITGLYPVPFALGLLSLVAGLGLSLWGNPSSVQR